jgi:hypothetical protein
MGVIGWIIFGLIVGAVAKFLMPGPGSGRVDRHYPVGDCGGAGRGLFGPCRGLVWPQ